MSSPRDALGRFIKQTIVTTSLKLIHMSDQGSPISSESPIHSDTVFTMGDNDDHEEPTNNRTFYYLISIVPERNEPPMKNISCIPTHLSRKNF